MQAWISENDTCVEGDIHFVYREIGNPAAGGTVGVENDSGTAGTSYFFNGEGVAPAAGDELRISSSDGDTANLGFEVVTDCSVDVIGTPG